MRRDASRNSTPGSIALAGGLLLASATLAGPAIAEESPRTAPNSGTSKAKERPPSQDGQVGGARQIRFPEQELDGLADRFAGRIGFYAKSLATGTEYSWNGDQRFPPASVIKLPVMIEFFRQAAAGTLDLDAVVPLPSDISTHGSGVLKRRDGPVALTLREYCRLMMVHSDNMATDLVMRKVGLGAVNRFLRELGLENTRARMDLGRWHYVIVGMAEDPISRRNDDRILEQMHAGEFDDGGLGYSDSLDNNVCGPRDIGALLEQLYRGKLANRKGTAEMLEMMRASTHKRTIAKYVKEGVPVANKYGGSRRIAADAGIVELSPGPVVIAAFALSADPSDRSGREILARMSRLAVGAVDPSAVDSAR